MILFSVENLMENPMSERERGASRFSQMKKKAEARRKPADGKSKCGSLTFPFADCGCRWVPAFCSKFVLFDSDSHYLPFRRQSNLINGRGKKWPVDGILPTPHRIRFMGLVLPEDDKLQLRAKWSVGKPSCPWTRFAHVRLAIYKEMFTILATDRDRSTA